MTTVLDIPYLETLFSGEPEALAALVRDVVVATRGYLNTLSDELGERSPTASTTVHACKGLCLNVGAHELSTLLERLETTLRHSDWTAACALLPSLEHAHRQLSIAAVGLLP